MPSTHTLKLGHLTIDPEQLGEHAPLWTNTSGLLVAQAMAPAAGLEQAQVAKLNLLTCGSGSTLAAFLAVKMRCNHVDVILHPDEKQQLEEVLSKITSPTTINIISSPEQISGEHKYHMAAYGCDGEKPKSLNALEPLVKHLRHEGQLVLFGFPESDMQELFNDAADKGLSLRASGFRDGLAFFSGSLESRNKF
jgi:threonine dehydrogenase-like Zn-dependent dehydrogenase|tara:strand:- start:121 stop:702 length:582 start_codon:yes stop_codon:yes gene_type:complete